MDLYLMQHGEAASAEVDPDRPLTEQGRESVRAVATHAASCGVRIDRLVHSGKTRAEQSAHLLAEVVGCAQVQQQAGLRPGDDVVAAASSLDPAATGSLGIVGHLPFLDRLASLLVAGDPAARVVAFRNGGLVKLVPGDGSWSVAWVVTPEVAGG